MFWQKYQLTASVNLREFTEVPTRWSCSPYMALLSAIPPPSPCAALPASGARIGGYVEPFKRSQAQKGLSTSNQWFIKCSRFEKSRWNLHPVRRVRCDWQDWWEMCALWRRICLQALQSNICWKKGDGIHMSSIPTSNQDRIQHNEAGRTGWP